MKKLSCLMAVLLIFTMLTGCGAPAAEDGDTVLATTYPMYYLSQRLLGGVDGVTVEVLVQEPVSCVHDYTLTTTQMVMIEKADLVVMNGADLEHFMESAMESVSEEKIVDCSSVLGTEDPHYWLNPAMYEAAMETLFEALNTRYPQHHKILSYNSQLLGQELTALQTELRESLAGLSCRELITFHDGFSSFATGLDLTVAAAIEEEEGSEASAKQIKEICDLMAEKNIPAVFVEKNGPTNAADIISAETGAQVFVLNTMMDGQTDYFTAMRENVAAVKEALS